MTEPSVVAVMLTADRPEMTRQAVASFRAQTYQHKRLLILDTGTSRQDAHVYMGRDGSQLNERLLWNPSCNETIGALRNIGARQADDDIIVHFDSDDLSHPNRIAEQVGLLQSSGADVVGYNQVLFWRERVYCHRDDAPEEKRTRIVHEECVGGPAGLVPNPADPNGRYIPCLKCGGRTWFTQAWLYRQKDPRYAIGASLMYWRAAWERRPFDDTSMGEDARFIAGLKCVGVSSFGTPFIAIMGAGSREPDILTPPRLLCRIHPGNSSTAYRPEEMRAVEKRGGEWSRVPAWDKYCEREFA